MTKRPQAAKPTLRAGLLRILARTDLIIENILILALVLLIIYFASASSAFFTVSNIEVILTNYAVIGVLVSAMALLVIAGHVDLSVGSNIGFAGTLIAMAATEWGWPAWASILLGIFAGGASGCINGLLCAVLRFNPVIVTLGMLGVLRGASLLVHTNEMYGLGPTFEFIGNGAVFAIPVLLIVVATAFLGCAAFISLTVWGRYIYAIGINPQAAFLAALPVRGLPFALYVVTGVAAGFAAVLSVARLDGSSPGTLGLQIELQALTIVLLGGVAFTGGRGRVLGVVTAWVFLGVLENGLTMLNVTPFVQLVAAGLALILAAGLDALGSTLESRFEQWRRAVEQMDAGFTQLGHGRTNSIHQTPRPLTNGIRKER
jgi:ribose/xylose/arabinose/galactoside ABC-type transport system permease subunit